MTDTVLEALLRRDRLLIAGALGMTAALAWGYVLRIAADTGMGGMDMTGFRMIPAGLGLMAPANAPWGGIEFAFVFVMWAVMMIAMMAPPVAPMILTYARVGREENVRGKPLAATAWFAARSPWPRSLSGPAIGELVLLPHSHLILEPHLYRRVRCKAATDFLHASGIREGSP
jgi:predicted metal-binding membrane protein